MEKIHTLVMHTFSDIEVLFMSFVLKDFDEAREKLGIDPELKLKFKFIASGALRPEDWPDEPELTAEALEEKGYLFLDCGGGRFDQHGKPVNSVANTMSSLDLMVHALELDRVLPQLMPIVEVISKNDITGQDVARDPGMRKSKTPHTPRHLRNIVHGWNLLFPDKPEVVMTRTHAAFRGMVYALPTTEGPVNGLFLLDGFMGGRTTSVAREYRIGAEEALDAMEADWDRSVQDYWSNTRVMDVTFASETQGVTVHKTITLAAGDSATHRYGQVTRLGNQGPRHKRPHQGRKYRNKADVTIQFREKGKFIISTRGIELERVAKALREADLRKKGVDPSMVDIDLLRRTGNLTVPGPDGREVSAGYLAEYRTCFGNSFRTNPNADKTALTRREIIDLTVKALGSID